MDSQKPQFKHPELQYRGRVNEELAGRYGWLVHNLEKTVKDDAAAAHRTATQLRNTCERFERALSDEQKLALKAAASAMGRLARELEELKPWSRAKVAHKKSESVAKAKFDEEVFAQERWRGDQAAMMAELGHARAFVGDEGKAWLAEKYQVSRVLLLGQDADLLTQSAAGDARAALVKFLQGLRDSRSETESTPNWKGEVTTTRWAGWHDYCLFLTARTGADASARAALDKMAGEK